jgi:uncharacterized protein
MQRMIFTTLPVTDVPRARTFYEALGFTINDQFSDATTACVVVSETIYFMVGLHEAFRKYAHRPLVLPGEGVSSLITLSCASRDEVDAISAAAVAAGGSEVHGAEDLGFMYSRAFADPDGNAFGVMWMKPSAGG